MTNLSAKSILISHFSIAKAIVDDLNRKFPGFEPLSVWRAVSSAGKVVFGPSSVVKIQFRAKTADLYGGLAGDFSKERWEQGDQGVTPHP